MDITHDIINSIGLGLDAIGIILLFFFGLPSDVTKDGTIGLAAKQKDECEARRWKRYRCISQIALIFLLTGFGLQIVSNHIALEPVKKSYHLTGTVTFT